MKKQLLMIAAVAITVTANAQNRPAIATVPASIAKKAVKTTKSVQMVDNVTPYKSVNPTTAVAAHPTNANKNGNVHVGINAATEWTIGNTDYDLQSNAAVYPRISNNGDNTISAAWTFIPDGGASAQRGTGYNYFDGTAWGALPTARIEPASRTGFTNLVVTGSGQEAAFCHSSAAPTSIQYTSRPAKGTGAWTEDKTKLTTGGATNSDTWARAVAGGPNNQSIHVITNTNDQGNAGGTIIYSRSIDDGATFGILRDTIPGMGAGSYPYFNGGDSYNIAAKGNTVAVVLGDFTTDVALFKSSDNGTTWTKTYVTTNFAGGSYDVGGAGTITDLDGDGNLDTVQSTAGDVNVSIDQNGNCHVFFGVISWFDDNDTLGVTSFSFFPSENGIGYWNETMAPGAWDIITGALDWDGNGTLDIPNTPDPTWTDPNESNWGRYGNMGLSCVPSSAVDAAGNIFLSYMAINELADNTAYFKSHYHIFLIASIDGGTTWTTPYNVVAAGGNSDSLFLEGSYASMAPLVDNDVTIVYQRDYFPGIFTGSPSDADIVNNDPAANTNDLIAIRIPKNDPAILGVNEITAPNASFSVSQNSPNPFKGNSTFELTLMKNSDVTVNVFNAVGQLANTSSYKNLSTGVHTLTLNGSQLTAGVYYYTVKADNSQVTHKMIIK